MIQHDTTINVRGRAGALIATWADPAIFPLQLHSGDSLKLTLDLGPRLSAAQITAVDPPSSAVVVAILPPGDQATLTDNNSSDTELRYNFSVEGTAIFKGEVRPWKTDPELVLRTGMDGP